MIRLCLIFLICCQIFLCDSALKEKNKSGKHVQIKINKGPVNKPVLARNLVVEYPSAKEIIREQETFYEDVDKINFNGTVLGYVTPWNNHGYNIAKRFANKFSQISPVWLQIRPTQQEYVYEVTGTHDVDSKWISDVKVAGSQRKTKVVPRVLFDNWTVRDYYRLFYNVQEQIALGKKIIETCTKYKFDGVVVEMWSQLAGRIDDSLIVSTIQNIGMSLRDEKLELVLVIPPIRGEDTEMFNAVHFDQLYDYVSGFSLMTYDYSSVQRPGPNSPLDWMRLCVKALTADEKKRSKIFMGLNLYGYDYTSQGGGPIVAQQYLGLLTHLKGKLKLDSDSKEHFFEVRNENGHHFVFYPTLYSIQRRIELAQELGVGLSLWELGQGLDYFYDLL